MLGFLVVLLIAAVLYLAGSLFHAWHSAPKFYSGAFSHNGIARVRLSGWWQTAHVARASAATVVVVFALLLTVLPA